METRIAIFSIFVLGLCVFIATRVDFYSTIKELINNPKQKIDLGVCILSARHHFEARKAIRNSWLSELHDLSIRGNKVVAKFVVGRDACSIHPDDRVDTHACKRWEPRAPENHQEVAGFLALSGRSGGSTHAPEIVQYLYVKVMSSIKLTHLGFIKHSSFVKLDPSELFRVVLYDSVTDGEVVHTTFSSSLRGAERDGYVYRPVEHVVLPKGYEFVLEVELPGEIHWPEASKDDLDIYSQLGHHNIVVTQLTDKAGRVLSEDKTSNYIPAVSFIFALEDTDGLQNHIKSAATRDTEWKSDVATISSRLMEEAQLHDDIMLLDMQDVYRSLPLKVLLCHKWFQTNFQPEHVLKTDDDCYINLPDTVKSLSEEPKDGTLTWRGNFRHQWGVERHGKWREPDYTASIYPQFACGSGYVVSGAVSAWLVQNRQRLRLFQGEDVSMGVWLAGMSVRSVQDSRWRCDMTCRDDMLALPELSPDQIMWHWNNSRVCVGKPCDVC